MEKNQRSCDNNMYHASYGAFVPYHTFYSTVLCRHGGVDKVCTCHGGQYSGRACVRIFAQMLFSPQTFYQGDCIDSLVYKVLVLKVCFSLILVSASKILVYLRSLAELTIAG